MSFLEIAEMVGLVVDAAGMLVDLGLTGRAFIPARVGAAMASAPPVRPARRYSKTS